MYKQQAPLTAHLLACKVLHRMEIAHFERIQGEQGGRESKGAKCEKVLVSCVWGQK